MLERRVVERTAELATANDRLQVEMAERARTEEALRHSQKVEAIGWRTSGVAHDVDNLLTIIRSSVDLLRRRELPEDRRCRYTDAISDTADMMSTTVGPSITIETTIRCDPCFIDADANRFETSLLDMAVDACDAMDDEGVLTIGVAHAATIPGDEAGPDAPLGFVAIAVADTGHGIPAERLQRIFEPFYTTKDVGKGVDKGTGLGLSRVYGFAKQSGGEVRVDSEIGRSTAFTLYLPQVAPPIAASDDRPGAAGPPARAHGRILLVEDNAQVGERAAQLLEDLGYSTVRAGDAATALALVDGEAFDVVFSDVVMPGTMSGVDLANELKRSYPRLPVVPTTGYSEALADGAAEGIDVLREPHSVEALSRIMRRACTPRADA